VEGPPALFLPGAQKRGRRIVQHEECPTNLFQKENRRPVVERGGGGGGGKEAP